MEQVISAVVIITGSENVTFEVGKNGIGDIIEANDGYAFYNEKDELMFKIRNCPVLVSYQKVG